MLELFNYGITTGKIPLTPYAAEQEFKLPFEDEIVIVGKIDRIDKTNDGIIITDYKSGSVAPDEWFLRHDLQLTCYAWACLELFGELPVKLIWHHLRKGHMIETTRTMSDIEDLKTMLRNAISMNKQEIRYRVFHQQICRWCDFAGHGNECEDKELEAQLVEQRNQLHVTQP